ncbi:MAG: sigma-70 family RNA polymerase sigma factor [Saprospiraceae bacterium]|nr:sigma-70 family RNA polymerase sigma factor [Saprospiraceae bacterium]
MSEETMIEGCVRQDASCQKQLFLLYSRKMMTVCLRYARNRADAEDILQDGFVRLFQNIKQYKGKGSFEGWIRRIFVNASLKKYQAKKWNMEQSGLDYHQNEAVDATVISSLSEKEIIEQIRQLPEGYRVVFNMYVIEGYSHKEISETLGINEATSRTQLLKARKHLQNKITTMTMPHES